MQLAAHCAIDEFLKKQGSEECPDVGTTSVNQINNNNNECPDKHCKLTMLCAIVIFGGCVLELTSVTHSRTWFFFFRVF